MPPPISLANAAEPGGGSISPCNGHGDGEGLPTPKQSNKARRVIELVTATAAGQVYVGLALVLAGRGCVPSQTCDNNGCGEVLPLANCCVCDLWGSRQTNLKACLGM